MKHVFRWPSVNARVPQLITLSFVFLFATLYVLNTDWQGSIHLHTLMESLSTLLALFVATIALLRYYSRKEVQFLYLGYGFLTVGFLDSYHSIVTSGLFYQLFPTDYASLVVWSWSVSRIFLSCLMVAIVILALRHDDLSYSRKKSLIFILSLASFILISFAIIALVPLPDILYEQYQIHRPYELISAIFFGIALIGHLSKGLWRANDFEYWLVIALVISLSSQLLMSFSKEVNDVLFNYSHIGKALSYLTVLVGMLLTISAVYKENSSLTRRLNIATDFAGIGVWEWNIEQDILTWNKQMHELYGLEGNEFSGTYDEWLYLVHPDDRAAGHELIKEVLDGNGNFEIDFRIQKPDKTISFIRASARLLRDKQNNPVALVGTNYDLTLDKTKELDLIRAGQDIQRLADTDELTQLYNRRKFVSAMPNELKRLTRDKSLITLCMIDIDYFKELNDKLGHQAGDDVLCQLAKVLKDSMRRPTDYAFRLGGDEFCLVFSGLEVEESFKLAEGVRFEIENLCIPHKNNKVSKWVTVSIGLVEADMSKNIFKIDEIYKLADQALYKAKAAGRNRVQIVQYI